MGPKRIWTTILIYTWNDVPIIRYARDTLIEFWGWLIPKFRKPRLNNQLIKMMKLFLNFCNKVMIKYAWIICLNYFKKTLQIMKVRKKLSVVLFFYKSYHIWLGWYFVTYFLFRPQWTIGLLRWNNWSTKTTGYICQWAIRDLHPIRWYFYYHECG